MSDYQVRLATLDDLEALLGYQTPVGGDLDATRARLRHDFEVRVPAERTLLVLASVAEGVVGVGRCSYIERPYEGLDRIPSGWYLQGVRVSQGWRRQGIGRALTRRRLEWLERRTDTIYYTTLAGNRPSIALHRAFGFDEIARGVDAPAAPVRADRLLFRRQRAGLIRPPPAPDTLS